MAKRKYKKRTNTKATRKKASNIDLAVIGLIIFSILLSVLLYGKSGIVGIKLNEILGGMMGIIEYILPIGIFICAIKIACDDKEYMYSKLTQYAILLISFAVLMSLYQINANELIIANKNMSTIVKDAYALGIQGNGGGALGVIIAIPFAKLLSPIGAMILFAGIIIMLIVFIFGINISEIINNFVEKSQENRESQLERKQQIKEEREKQKQEMLAQRQKGKKFKINK